MRTATRPESLENAPTPAHGSRLIGARLAGANTRSRWWWVLTLVLGALILINDYRQHLGYTQFKVAFVNSLGLLIALLAFLFWMRGRPVWTRRIFENHWHVVGLLALMLIGAWARTYRLDVYPPEDGQLWEESQIGAGAYASWQTAGLDNFFPLPTLAAELSFRVLGVSMRTLRLPFIVLGIASIGVFFLAARCFFKTYFAAWFATGLFAISAQLAGAARIAGEWMSPIFTECLALAGLFYACTRRDLAAFALAGFVSGLLMTEYFGFKIVSVYGGLLLVTALAFEPSPYCNAGTRFLGLRGWFRNTPLLLVAFGFALAVIIPILLSNPGAPLSPFIEGIARHKAALSERMGSESLRQALGDASGRVRMVATYLFVGGGGADLLPVTLGAIDYYTGVLGVVSLGYCALAAWRSPAKLFLVVAVVVTVVLSGALVRNPMRYRLIHLLPIWFLGVGTAVDDLGDWLPRCRRTAAVSAIALLAGLAAVNYRNLFVIALNDSEVQVNFYDIHILIAKEIAALQTRDPEAIVYVLSRCEHLAYVNDYYFLYDHKRVHVVGSVDLLQPARGYLVADTEFVDVAADYPRSRDCRRWRTALNRDSLVSCRLE